MELRYDVFLSHNSRDNPAVRELHQALVERGFTVWFDEVELVPGTGWIQAIEAGLEASCSVAVCLGAHGLGAWETPESEAALIAAIDQRTAVIPLFLPEAPADAKWPSFLRRYSFSDLRCGGLNEANLGNLARGILKARRAVTARRAPNAETVTEPIAHTQPHRHNLPFDSLGSLFHGREEALARLERDLAAGAAAVVQRTKAALLGLGGIGKTRLAVEYAWRHGGRYSAVLFVRADSPAALSANLAGLARLPWIDLPAPEGGEAEAVQAVLRWLHQHPGWLLILDNVDDEEAAHAVLDLLPSLSPGRVLITSRWTSWPPNIESEGLAELLPEQAAEFLLDRTAKRRQPREDDPAEARKLAEALGGLPLALEQAAAYVNKYRLSLTGYHKEWQEERTKVLAWYDSNSMQYPAPVAVTWQRSFERLKPGGVALLRLASFLAPDPIPVALFEQGQKHFAKAVRKLRGGWWAKPSVRLALADLEELSLVTHEGESFTVHRMVQEVVRGQMPPGERNAWLERALAILNRFAPRPPVDVRTWPVWDRLRPHVAAAAWRGSEAGGTGATAILMGELSGLLKAKALYEEAEPLIRRALDIDQSTFGDQHPRVAIELNNLALLLKDTNRLQEAEPLMRRALDIDLQAYGDQHPTVARDLNNLAALLQDTNRLQEAEPFMRRALDIDQQAYGDQHPTVARDLNNLALLLQDTNRLQEAEPLMRRALGIGQQAYGDQHPRVAIGLNNLAMLLKATNRLQEAETLMRRALDIDQQAYGDHHPTVARDLNNLALLLNATNRLQEAEPLMRRALDIFEQSLGTGHPSAQIARRNLGGAFSVPVADPGEPSSGPLPEIS